MAEAYKAPRGTEIHSDPIKKRIVAVEPNGDVVFLGFDFSNSRESGVIPAVERERFTAHDIALQRSEDQYAVQRAVEDARKMMDLRSAKTRVVTPE